MVTSRTFRDRFETILIYSGLSLFAVIAILPFLNTIARSFSAELWMREHRTGLAALGLAGATLAVASLARRSRRRGLSRFAPSWR